MEINCFQSLLSIKSTKLQDCDNGEVPLKSKNTLYSEVGLGMAVAASNGIHKCRIAKIWNS
jgi:hypothetical protein